jgi:hypothetical protein
MRRSATVRVAVEKQLNLYEIEQSEVLRFANRPVELVRLEDRAEVEQRPRNSRNRDATVLGDLIGLDRRTTGNQEPASPMSVPGRHLRPPFVLADTPQGSGGSVAEDGTVTAREHRAEPAPLATDPRMPHGIHAAVHDMQSLGPDATIDRARMQADRAQLVTPDHSVLATGKRRNRRIRPARVKFTSNSDVKFTRVLRACHLPATIAARA